MYRKILIATDGSEAARKAIAAGMELALLGDATVVGVHVRQPASVVAFGEASLMVPPEIEAELTRQLKEESRRLLAAVESEAREADLRCESVDVQDDSPAEAILRVAREHACDLIVMASHGRKGLSRVLLGSETSKVLARADRAVLVVR